MPTCTAIPGTDTSALGTGTFEPTWMTGALYSGGGATVITGRGALQVR